MSVIQLLLAAEAAIAERAVRSTAFRHRYLSKTPLVVVAFNLSGEAAAPLGFCHGTNPARPKVLVAAEPRNRESRFGAINAFAADFTKHILPYLELVEMEGGRGAKTYTFKAAEDAPQIVFPNRATRDYVTARLGRSLRYLGLGDTHEVPDETSWAGSHLSYLAEHAHLPGQSMVLAATELLERHFVTGQSGLENENLATLLAWIENPPGAGRKRMRDAESAAYGPVPDPDWEAKLEPSVRAWSQANRAGNQAEMRRLETVIHGEVEAVLLPAYAATHRAIEIMREVPEATHVAERWAQDIRLWSKHARRAQRGIPRFSRRHDARRAAQLLELWSRALEAVAYEEALDDPMVLAELDAAGRCVVGKVRKVNADHREVKPGNKRATSVPLVEIALDEPTRLLPGEAVLWSRNDKVTAVLRAVDEKRAELAVMGGHNRGTTLPSVGDNIVFAALSVFGGGSPEDPDDVPWTHRPAESSPALPESSPDLTLIDGPPDEAPDLALDELATLPLVGAVPLGDVPGVVI